MRLQLFALTVVCLLTVISAKKQIEDNADPIEAESNEHSQKKYSKDNQKSHHHGSHKHKKHSEHQPESRPKASPAAVPEPEVQLQSDLETSQKTLDQKNQRAQTEDLHLQDLTYEQNLKKEKKKRKDHHAAHQPEVAERKKEPKLFDEQGRQQHSVGEKVIEDSFEPIQARNTENGEKKNKKTKNGKKKAHEKKNKDKNKKSKEGKKNKNKDKKNKDKKL